MSEEPADYITETKEALEMLGTGYEEKAKHTPGSWKVETFTRPSYNGDMEFSIISGSKGWANSGMRNQRVIAEVGHWKDRPNPEADARLIAAAPELLEALNSVVFGFDHEMIGKGREELQNAIIKARAAIAEVAP